MPFYTKIIRKLICLCCFTVMFSTQAHAQLMQSLTIGSPKALALANAVTATPTGIDSIHYNPAGLSHYKNRNIHLKVLVGVFDIQAQFGDYFDEAELAGFVNFEDDTIPNTESQTSTPAIMLPGVGVVKPPFLGFPLGGMMVNKPGSPFTFGTSVYSPAGFGYAREADDPARYQGQTVAMVRLTYFSPSFGMEVSDTLSIGASLGFSWQGMGMEMAMRSPHILLAGIEALGNQLCPDGATEAGRCASLGDPVGTFEDAGFLSAEMEDAMSLSFNLGAMWDVTPWLSLGFVYQSEGKADLEGDFKLEYSEAWYSYWQRQTGALSQLSFMPEGHEVESGKIKTTMIQSQHASIGMSLRVTPSITINADLKWTDTGSWDEFKFEFDTPIDIVKLAGLIQPEEAPDPYTLILPRGYVSTTSWALGMEYQWDEELTLRVGVEDRPSGIPDDRQDALMPVADTYLYGAGFAYQWDSDTLLELGLGYFKSKADVPANTSYNANYTGYQEGKPLELATMLYNPYAGISFKTQVTAYLLSFSYLSKF